MYAKLCDNCNDIASIEDQKCIELDFPYDRLTRHFCNRRCLDEYLDKENDREILLYNMKVKIIEILGTDNIDKINQLINDTEKDTNNSKQQSAKPSCCINMLSDELYPDHGGIYRERVLRGEIVNSILRDIIKDDE